MQEENGLLLVEAENLISPTLLLAVSAVTVSATSGGNAERVLEAIAVGNDSLPYNCHFGDWCIGPSSRVKECEGAIYPSEASSVPVIFRVGAVGEISLMDFRGSEWHPRGAKRGYVICIGNAIPQSSLSEIAHQLILWIVNMR
jgi:hypothetical protein